MKLIDLSHTISPSMPVYPGSDPPSLDQACSIEKDGFAEKRLVLFSHSGTHVDAPAHILPGAPTLDRQALDRFCGRAAVLDLTNLPGKVIGPAALESYRHFFEENHFILLHTGWGRLWGKDEYFRGFPVLSPEAAHWACGFGLKGIGVDAISVDRVGPAGFPVHEILLGHGLVIVENLANLDLLPAGQSFNFCCFPLNIQGGDGSPVRAVALT